MKQMLPAINRIVLFFLIIFLLSFWGLTIFPESLYGHMFYFAWVLICSSFFLFKKESIYGKYLILINIFLFINSLGCSIIRGQNVITTYEGHEMSIIGMLNFYFIALSLKNKVSDYESILFHLSIIMCILYIVQYVIYPQVIFRDAGNALMYRELYESADARVRVIGQMLGPLAYYMGLNKFFLGEKKSAKYLIQALLGLTVVLMLGFRIQLFVLLIFTAYMFMKIFGFSNKMLLYVTIIGLFLYYVVMSIPFVQDTIEHMIERNQDGSSEEARYITAFYFYNNFFYNNWELIMGAGLPGNAGAYSQTIDHLKDVGIYFSDCGLLGYSWVAGIPVALLLSIFPLISLFKKVPNAYMYIGITMAFVLFSSTFTREIYREGNPLLIGVLLAMHDKILCRKNVY
jgi:hypothetical protein